MIGCPLKPVVKTGSKAAGNATCLSEPIRSWSHSCAVWGRWPGHRQARLDQLGSQQALDYQQGRHGEVTRLHVTCWGLQVEEGRGLMEMWACFCCATVKVFPESAVGPGTSRTWWGS